MKFTILSFLFLFNTYAGFERVAAVPEIDDPICELENPYLISKREIEDTPNYFFRTNPDRNEVYYNGEGTNYVLNLDTGERQSLPGQYDPVPSEDGRVLTTPVLQRDLKFYDMERLRSIDSPSAEDYKSALLLDDDEMIGVYQSTANLEPDGSLIRVITDEKGSTFRDYRVSTRFGRTSVRADGPPTRVCENRDIKLPMISKDGRLMAARDMNDTPPTTKIFSLSNDGSCEVVQDLGVQAGKVDFNYDGTKLVFHQAVDQVEDTDYFKTSESTVQDIFVYDLTDGSTRKITNNYAGATSYFPVWNRDDTIVYIDRDTDGGFAFSTANPFALSSNPVLENLEIGQCTTREQNILSILGEQWIDICLQTDHQDRQNSILTALSLNRSICTQLVNQHYSQLESMASSRNIILDREELLSLCPETDVIEVDREDEAETTPEQLFSVKCATCHAGLAALNEARTQSASSRNELWVDEAIARINSSDPTYSMPMGGSLNTREKGQLNQYLQSFRGQ
ncbi:MAG: hypothetical protein CME65_02985 [Halobacteriovoraceae bacterium]|nr:hypothetical protein [Halobacteriovoraceae bacterium]|tara:strand:+ start:10445 stop:11974 length:1530 start_codon:yes stop_codon:yes gene_type:complete